MINLSDDDRKEILGEVLMDELKVIREYLEDVPVIKQDVRQLKEDLAEVKADLKVMKAVARDQSEQLGDHEVRISALEIA